MKIGDCFYSKRLKCAFKVIPNAPKPQAFDDSRWMRIETVPDIDSKIIKDIKVETMIGLKENFDNGEPIPITSEEYEDIKGYVIQWQSELSNMFNNLKAKYNVDNN